MRTSVDVGGTFTDVTVMDDASGDIRFEKVQTTPEKPTEGVISGFAKSAVDLKKLDYFVHGTTLPLNALLTRSGARVGIVTTKGFRDVYILGRNDREPMYDFKYVNPPLLAPRKNIFEVEERMNYKGEVLTPLSRSSAIAVAEKIRAAKVDAVAICFLHSYINPAHEQEMLQILAEECPGVSVTISSELSREYREYERTSTAVVDAYIKPISSNYLSKLERALDAGGFRGNFLLTRSGGGVMNVDTAKEQPAHLILSGPAGGVIGASAIADLIGHKNLITFDMGGTSLDVSLIEDGRLKIRSEQNFEGMPISVPAADIHTIGAGGGSIAWLDDAGHLQVGPKSAGASPGPACYNNGGEDATVTDAAIVLGYLDADNFLGGELAVDGGLSAAAVDRLAKRLQMRREETAAGILRISEAKMAGAVRVISIEQGHHPKNYAIFAFGGGGSLVACRVARELGVGKVIVPPGPGNFAAFGMLMADVVHDFSQTYVTVLSSDSEEVAYLNGAIATLEKQGRDALVRDGFSETTMRITRTVELRYQGQEHTVGVELPDEQLSSDNIDECTSRFAELHRAQYGHDMEDPIEVVTVRIRATGVLEKPTLKRLPERQNNTNSAKKGMRPVYQFEQKCSVDYGVYDRALLFAKDNIEGPAIIEERSSTVVIHAGDSLDVGDYGELVVTIGLS